MKKPIVMFVFLAVLASCGQEKEEDPTQPVTDEVKKELKEAEDLNVELEKIDGEIDSLMNTLE